MLNNSFSRKKRQGEPSGDRKPSSHSPNRSVDGTVKIKDNSREFDAHKKFAPIVNSLKNSQTSLKHKYNDKAAGIKNSEDEVHEAIENLQMALETYANKLIAIRELTKEKEDYIGKLDSVKEKCGRKMESNVDPEEAWKYWLSHDVKNEKTKQENNRRSLENELHARVRYSTKKKYYKGDWFKFSDEDEYFLEKYNTKGFKPEDVIQGENGLKRQLEDSFKKIKWYDNPKEDFDWIYRDRCIDLSKQELGRMERRVTGRDIPHNAR
ncbi:hypothetical protein ACHAP3_008965 [Botrytis cinerea]